MAFYRAGAVLSKHVCQYKINLTGVSSSHAKAVLFDLFSSGSEAYAGPCQKDWAFPRHTCLKKDQVFGGMLSQPSSITCPAEFS